MDKRIKNRLNKKLISNNMATLNNESTKPAPQIRQLQQVPPKLYRNRTYDTVDSAECENRLVNNTDNNGIPYGHGEYDDRQHDNYLTLQETTEPTFWKSLSIGNEQLMIIALAGLAAFAMYILSKSKDK